MSDESKLVDPSPTTPVEYLEAQGRNSEKFIRSVFQRHSNDISNALKNNIGRSFELSVPDRDATFMPCIEKAAGLLKDHFEKVGWEVSICGDHPFYRVLYFNLPGARAKRRKVFKIIGIVTALIVLGGLGSVFGYPVVKEKFFTKSAAEIASDAELNKLIAKSGFGYVNDNITAANFPDVGVKTTPLSSEAGCKVYHFDRFISSGDAIGEMEKDGYRPANLRELIAYSQNGWNGTDRVVALGQIWWDADDFWNVPGLGFDGGRELSLYWCGSVWFESFRFLAVRK